MPNWEVAMFVDEMSRVECRRVLAEAPIARLASAADGQPFVVPVYVAYDRTADGDDFPYGFATVGQKIEWMRANPLVCVEVDNVIGQSEWLSVVAFGSYEELPNIHEQAHGRAPARSAIAAAEDCINEQLLAHNLLKARAMWWEPAASIRTNRAGAGHFDRISPVFYKIHLTQITGFRATSESTSSAAGEDDATPNFAEYSGWLGRILHSW
jgi:uncharacterized protein